MLSYNYSVDGQKEPKPSFSMQYVRENPGVYEFANPVTGWPQLFVSHFGKVMWFKDGARIGYVDDSPSPYSGEKLVRSDATITLKFSN